jgi:hypothetical protein
MDFATRADLQRASNTLMCNAPVSEVQAKAIAPVQGILHTLMQVVSEISGI